MANSFAFAQEERNSGRTGADHDLNKKLLTRCANALFSEREFSGPEVMSYLMGLEDRFESHIYSNVYWDAAVGSLTTAFPSLKGDQ